MRYLSAVWHVHCLYKLSQDAYQIGWPKNQETKQTGLYTTWFIDIGHMGLGFSEFISLPLLFSVLKDEKKGKYYAH